MEPLDDRSAIDTLLIGLEEIYSEPFFAKLRLAFTQVSQRQKLYEILSAVATLHADESSHLIKMREALDRSMQSDFWLWYGRALEEKFGASATVDRIKNLAKTRNDIEKNFELLSLLTADLTPFTSHFEKTSRVLEHIEKDYAIEALRSLSQDDTPAAKLLQGLRKFLKVNKNEDATMVLLRCFRDYPTWEWTHRLTVVLDQCSDSFNWESLSRSQIISKKWLIKEVSKLFDKELTHVHILCGWYGLLGTLFFLSNKFNNLIIRSYDKDEKCLEIAKRFNHAWLIDNGRFAAFTKDIQEIDYGMSAETGMLLFNKKGEGYREPIDLLVNTSCEHLDNFECWYDKIPKGTRLALQSNNGFDIEGHVNCVRDLEAFKQQAPMSQLLYAGEMSFQRFTRFMLIGYR